MSTGYHDVHLREHPAARHVWKVLAEHLSRWVPPDAHVLEVGAGYCHWINAVRAARRVAIDNWPRIVEFAGPGVETRVMDAARELTTFPPAHFDTILASNVIEHFEPETAARIVGDMHAILKVRGHLIVVQPNFRYAYRSYFDDYTHRSVFTDVSLPALLRTRGFRIVLVEPRFLPYSMRGVHRTIPPWLVRAYLASPVKPRAGQMLVIATRD